MLQKCISKRNLSRSLSTWRCVVVLIYRRLRTCCCGWRLHGLSVAVVLWQTDWPLSQVRLQRLRRQWQPISLQRSLWTAMSHQQVCCFRSWWATWLLHQQITLLWSYVFICIYVYLFLHRTFMWLTVSGVIGQDVTKISYKQASNPTLPGIFV